MADLQVASSLNATAQVVTDDTSPTPVPSVLALDSNATGSGHVGVGTTSKLSRMTVVGSTEEINIGGTTTADETAVIDGTGTQFLTKVYIGDLISLTYIPHFKRPFDRI